MQTLLGVKGFVLLIVSSGLVLWSTFNDAQFQTVDVRWPREGAPVFASHFATWDGAHYLYLSEVGYAAGVPSCAFYPLWPLVMQAAAPVFAGSHLIAGLVLANGFSLAAWVLFYRLVARRWGERAGRWALIFLIAFPGALFFQFIYSESLFLLLVVGLWWGLERRRYGWAAVCAGLLPLCRGVGVFVLVLYSVPVLWRLDKGLLVWTWWLGVIPAMSGTFTSFTRFASCAFPVFIGLGIVLSRREWRWVRYGLFAVFATLHIALVWRYVNFRWAG